MYSMNVHLIIDDVPLVIIHLIVLCFGTIYLFTRYELGIEMLKKRQNESKTVRKNIEIIDLNS